MFEINEYFKWYLTSSPFSEFCFSTLPYYRITTWPPQKKKKKISFFLFPLPLGQICFVLVLISPNHKARNRYPEMVMARTATRFDNNALKLMSISDVYGLQRLMSEPTRIRPTSATLIDLIYANFMDKI